MADGIRVLSRTRLNDSLTFSNSRLFRITEVHFEIIIPFFEPDDRHVSRLDVRYLVLNLFFKESVSRSG